MPSSPMSSIENTSAGGKGREIDLVPGDKDVNIFNAYHDADLVLQTSDGIDIWVHKLILARVSSVFRDMFQSSDAELKVSISEPADIIIDILEFIYSDFCPKGFQVAGSWKDSVSDPARLVQIDRFRRLVELTVKYDMPSLQGRITDSAMASSFLKDCPLDCFGLANRYGTTTHLTRLRASALEILCHSSSFRGLMYGVDVRRALKAGVITGEEYFDLLQKHK